MSVLFLIFENILNIGIAHNALNKRR